MVNLNEDKLLFQMILQWLTLLSDCSCNRKNMLSDKMSSGVA